MRTGTIVGLNVIGILVPVAGVVGIWLQERMHAPAHWRLSRYTRQRRRLR
jgi:hypothetical protein